MNRKKMRIVITSDGFVTQYDIGSISASIVCFSNNTIRFIFKNVAPVKFMLPKKISLEFYQAQFGITVTEDGSKFFIQTWEKGLYCFSVRTGEILWHIKENCIEELATFDKHLICSSRKKGLLKIRIEDGSIQEHFSAPSQESVFIPLENGTFFFGPVKNQYVILTGNFMILSYLSRNDVNPNNFRFFFINDANSLEDSILLSGIEYSDEREYFACDDVEKFKFYRIIEIASKKENKTKG